MTLTDKQRAWDKVKYANRIDNLTRRGKGSAGNGRAARRRARFGHGVEQPGRSRVQRGRG